VIRIDEIESSGSARLRLRSLIEALKANEMPGRTYVPRKSVKLFEAEDRQKQILTPYFSRFCAPTVAGPLLNMGYHIETLPPPDRESVEIGLRYTNNEICYPGIIVIGDVIKALQSGKYDLNNVVVGSWQTGGQCRASSILPLLKRALIATGFEDIPIVALTTDKSLHEQPGMNLNVAKYVHRALMAAVYSDAISVLYHATAVREVNKGESMALANELLAPLERGELALNRASILGRLGTAVKTFNTIRTRNKDFPKVGIVGEIYVKFNSFVNNQVAQWLIEQEIEVVVPPFLEFFLGWFVSANERVRSHISQYDGGWLLANALEGYVQGFLDESEIVLQGFKHYHPRHSIRDIAHKATDIVSLTHAYGEGWLIAGEIGEFVKSGVQNVLCLQPFGCIANQVVAKGVAKRLKEKYQNLNLLFLDLDAGVSEVNFFNRMYFFINHAKEANSIKYLE
jgi:predicted nucleotide-binding protein (sugar kinase/HSP70/actin superfamily)